jgi:hypothetical protein
VYHQTGTRRNKDGTGGASEKGAFLPWMPESLERVYLLLLKVAKARKVRNYPQSR